MANNIVADAFIELRAQTKEFDKALKDVEKKLKKGIETTVKVKADVQTSGRNGALNNTANLGAGAAGLGAAAAASAAKGATAAASAFLNASNRAQVLATAITRINQVYGTNTALSNQLIAVMQKKVAAGDDLTKVVARLNQRISEGSLVTTAATAATATNTAAEKISAAAKLKSIAMNNAVTGSSLSTIGALGKKGGALGVLTAAYIAVIRPALAYADTLENLAAQANLSTTAYQALAVVFKEAGFEQGKLIELTTKLNASSAQALSGNEQLVKAFEDLGISTAKLQSSSPEELLNLISQGLIETQGTSKGAAAALRILGESSGRVEAVLRGLNGSIEDVNAELEKSGLITSKYFVEVGDIAEKELNRTGGSVKKLARDFGIISGVGLSVILGELRDVFQEGDNFNFGRAVQDARDLEAVQARITAQVKQQEAAERLAANNAAQRAAEEARIAEAKEKALEAERALQELLARVDYRLALVAYDKEIAALQAISDEYAKRAGNIDQQVKAVRDRVDGWKEQLDVMKKAAAEQLKIEQSIRASLKLLTGAAALSDLQQTALIQGPLATKALEERTTQSPDILALERNIQIGEDTLKNQQEQLAELRLIVTGLDKNTEAVVKVKDSLRAPVGI